jgi:hypothetical protein
MTWATRIQEHRERQASEKAARIASQGKTSTPKLHAGTYEGNTGRAVPKPESYRDTALLDLARGQPCYLRAVENCCGADTATTVAAHRNEGKGMGIKASDLYTVPACIWCHTWFDQSGSPRAEKRRAFMAAHARWVLEWRAIATDLALSQRDRNAARRALEALNATALPEDGE